MLIKYKIKYALILWLIVVVCSLHGQPQNWQILSSRMPVPVAGAQAVVHDSLVYIMGGHNGPPGAFSNQNIIQEYHPADDFWILLQDTMRGRRSGFVADTYDNTAYYTGGIFQSTGFPHLFSMERWNFHPIPAIYHFNSQFNRVYATGLVHGDKLYLIGGYPIGNNPPQLNYLIEFDIDSATVTFEEDSLFQNQLQPYQQMSAVIDDDIYIFGGSQFGVYRTVYKFNTITKEITTVQPMNSVRAGGSAVSVNNDRIYIIGGYTESQPAVDSVVIFRPTQGVSQFSAGPSLNFPRQDLTAVNFYGTIYVFGGMDSNGLFLSFTERLDVSTPVEPTEPTIVKGFSLQQNYPNPFNASTIISYHLGQYTPVRIDIFSVTGQHIKTLVERKQSPGSHKIRWDGKDSRGNSVSSGIYLYKLTTEYFTDSKKMIVIQ
ncbi:MAG: T9SS type A sorting domain-containing protein [Aliifodinibius sp.]|nr:T9SS type A sorting domain-containing protein [Fodinibius sp.]NIY28519.1 T9SS type A sorting domain-containing protein [Fodinibius sp.]